MAIHQTVAMAGRAKFMKKKKQRVIHARNKFTENYLSNQSKENFLKITGSLYFMCNLPEITDTLVDQTTCSSNTTVRAKELQLKLPSRFPSCVKFMLRSHVTGGFWLVCLPRSFANLHLPNHDAIVALVDENCEEYSTKYLVEKNGLSAGWRRFSVAHKLLEGDVLVFQLITHCKIKVYIVRANRLSEIDEAIGHLNSEFEDMPINNGGVVDTIVKEKKHDMEDVNSLCVTSEKKVVMKPCMTRCHQEAIPKSCLKGLNDDEVVPASEKDAQLGSRTHDGGICSEMFDGLRFSEMELDFEDLQDQESFSILVNGLAIDSEIPKHLWSKYYDLCCSQNTFLHDCHLAKLAAGNRIKKLVCLQHEEQEIIKVKTLEPDQTEINIKNLEDELVRIKEVKRKLDAEIEGLRVKNENRN